MKKIYRKLLALICISATLFATSCASRDKSSVADINLSGQQTITIWYYDSKYEPYLEYVAKKIKASNELIDVKYECKDKNEYLEQIYNASVREDKGPDLYLMNSSDTEKAVSMGIAAENSTYAQAYTEAKYGRAAMDSMTYNSRIYGYPISFRVPFMVYNTKVASKPTSFDDIKNFVENYKVNSDNEKIETLVAWDIDSVLINYPFTCSSIEIGGSSGDDSHSIVVDSKRLAEYMTKFHEFKGIYGMDPDKITTDYCAKNFAEGKIAYTIIDSDHLAMLDSSGVSYEVVPVPSLSDSNEAKALSETTSAYVNAFSKNLSAAKAVAHALSYEYADQLYLSCGLMSAKKMDINNDNYKLTHSVVYNVYEKSQPRAQFIGQNYYYSLFQIMLTKVWDNKIDSSDAVKEFSSKAYGRLSDLESDSGLK